MFIELIKFYEWLKCDDQVTHARVNKHSYSLQPITES